MILKKKVESDVKDAILQFKTDNEITNGIRLIEDYKRYYPYGAFASAVLGCVGGDNQGLAGLEAYYDSTLTGTAGRLITAEKTPSAPICPTITSSWCRRRMATAWC